MCLSKQACDMQSACLSCDQHGYEYAGRKHESIYSYSSSYMVFRVVVHITALVCAKRLTILPYVVLLGSARGVDWRFGGRFYQHHSVSRILRNRACPRWCITTQPSSPAVPDPCNLDASCRQSQGLVHLPPTCIWTLLDHLCGGCKEPLYTRRLWRVYQKWPHHPAWSRSSTIHQHASCAQDNALNICCLVHVCDCLNNSIWYYKVMLVNVNQSSLWWPNHLVHVLQPSITSHGPSSHHLQTACMKELQQCCASFFGWSVCLLTVERQAWSRSGFNCTTRSSTCRKWTSGRRTWVSSSRQLLIKQASQLWSRCWASVCTHIFFHVSHLQAFIATLNTTCALTLSCCLAHRVGCLWMAFNCL